MTAWKLFIILTKNIFTNDITEPDFPFCYEDTLLAFVFFVLCIIIPCITVVGLICSLILSYA